MQSNQSTNLKEARTTEAFMFSGDVLLIPSVTAPLASLSRGSTLHREAEAKINISWLHIVMTTVQQQHEIHQQQHQQQEHRYQ